jgi:hypothetical protein
MMNPQTPPAIDHRPGVTRSIWRCGLGMLFLCIPLVPITGFDWLPMSVMGSAALGTIGVWMFGRPAASPKPERDSALMEIQKAVAGLEERLESVEVLNRFEERLARETASASRELEISREFEGMGISPRR